MPRKRRADPEPEVLSIEERNALAFHLRCMKLSETRYLAWCREYGFAPSLCKDERARERERAARKRQRSDAALALLRQRTRNPQVVLEELFEDRLDVERVGPQWRRARELLATLGARQDSREAYRGLLAQALARTKLFSAAPVIAEYPRDQHNCFLGALAALATHCHRWIRPLQDWQPGSKNAARQLGSLARHLLAEYDVPPFMDSVWFQRTRTQLWFVHLGRGGSVRTLVRPLVHLNRRMAHHFLSAPASYTPWSMPCAGARSSAWEATAG